MKFGIFLESKVVSTKLDLNKQQTIPLHGKHQGILFLVWLTLKLLAAYHFLATLVEYVGISVGLVQAPKHPLDIVTDLRVAEANKQAADKQFAETAVKGKNGKNGPVLKSIP